MSLDLRADLAIIEKWVPHKSKVLDLGCGGGALLAALKKKQVTGYGVEIEIEKIVDCAARGVNVIHADLEQGLALFEDKSFDMVILSQTLQTVHSTENVLTEMLRIAKEGIVTFPNFAYWRCRWQLLWGRMPVSEHLPHQWYNTPNIHLCTTHDFEQLIFQIDGKIIDRCLLHGHKMIRYLPNLRASLAVYRFCRR